MCICYAMPPFLKLKELMARLKVRIATRILDVQCCYNGPDSSIRLNLDIQGLTLMIYNCVSDMSILSLM